MYLSAANDHSLGRGYCHGAKYQYLLNCGWRLPQDMSDQWRECREAAISIQLWCFLYICIFLLLLGIFSYWLHLLDHVAVTVYGNYILLHGMTKFQLSLINTPFGKIGRDGQEESSLEDYKYPVKYIILETWDSRGPWTSIPYFLEYTY